jgi:hypothetical protein
VAGSYTFVISVTTTNGCRGTRTYTLDVGCPAFVLEPAGNPGILPKATTKAAYSAQITANPSTTLTTPFSFTVSSGVLPPGLTLDQTNGKITGTPTSTGAGTYDFTILFREANNCTKVGSFRIVVNQAPACIQAVAPIPCIGTGGCVRVPVTFTRNTTENIRQWHVKIRLTNLTVCPPCSPNNVCPAFTNGDFFAGVVGGSVTFQAFSNKDGTYEIDAALGGNPCGSKATTATLFYVDVTPTTTTGTGTVEILDGAPNDLVLRDCANPPAEIPVAACGNASFPINPTTGPPAITDLRSAQVQCPTPPNPFPNACNDDNGTIGIQLTFTAPSGVKRVEVWRKGYGNYPKYDCGVAPANPSSYTNLVAEGWTKTTVTASGGIDDVAKGAFPGSGRDFYYYVAYSFNACQTASAKSNISVDATTGVPGTLNYHLGDVHNGLANCQGDNRVDLRDISFLGANYGEQISKAAPTGPCGAPTSDPNGPGGDTDTPGCLDVGPTGPGPGPGGTKAFPRTDNIINFEDLTIFAINFETVSLTGHGPESNNRPTPASANELGLVVPTMPAVGETFDVMVEMRGAGDIQAVKVLYDYDAAIVEPVRVSSGALLAEQGSPSVVLSSEPGDVDVALLGGNIPGLSGEGAVARVTFRVKALGDARIALKSVDARNGENKPVTMGERQVAVAPKIPTETFLAASHPNPFMKSTSIKLGLARPGMVKLAVYDVHGRMVRSLVNGVHPAGEWIVTWDGNGDGAYLLPSGMYFIRLEADNRIVNRRVSMLR